MPATVTANSKLRRSSRVSKKLEDEDDDYGEETRTKPTRTKKLLNGGKGKGTSSHTK